MNAGAGGAPARGQSHDRGKAWSAFRTECYPTYDFAPIREALRQTS
jgi:hypothetical protein